MTRDIARHWIWPAVPAIGTALVVAFVLLPAGSTGQSILYDAIGLAAVVAALVGVVLFRPVGWQPWLLMIAGQLAFVIGDILWTYFELRGEEPYPSVADVSYLFGYPLLAVGLLLAIRMRISGGDRAGLLDAAILAVGASIVWWAFVLGPLAAIADPDPLSFSVSVAYPVGDLLLIGMALALVMTTGARTASFRLLFASLLAMLLADLEFGLQTLEDGYVEGGLLDSVWLISYVCFASAAAHPTMAALFEARPIAVTLLSPVRLGLLAIAMLVGPALLAVGRSGGDTTVLVVAGATAILSVLVLARLAGMVRLLDRDIERRKALEAQLSFQAYHDPLTGLANRRRFMAAIGDALAAPGGVAVLFLDLDDFKDINDNMGHDAGDALLSAVGERVVAAIRPGDLACRLGGDEFAVLLPNTDALRTAEQIAARLVEVLGAPLEIEGVTVRVPASVGVALRSPGEAMAVDELVRRADIAMYQAKARGKERWSSYGPELEAVAEESARRLVARRTAPAA